MSSKIIIRFKTNNGEKNFTYSYADPEISVSTVKTLINTMITNGEIFENAPTEAVSAILQTTTESEYNIDS